jgi:dynein heavy chain
MMNNYCGVWACPHVCEEGFMFNPTAANAVAKIPNDFKYIIPNFEGDDAIKKWQAYCSSFPDIDSPEVFGLHPNADITFRVKQASHLLYQLGESQPKDGGGGGGVSAADVVLEKAAEFNDRMPPDYQIDDYKAKINKLGGLAIPLNIFLYQEIQRLQNVVAKVREMLMTLRQAINGEVVMTEELQEALTAIFEAKPPKTWVYTVTGDEFSWILPTLGLWFASFLARDGQNRTWLESHRPNSYWMTGFFNPTGLLTAMKQEVTRRHKGEGWALDDMVYHSEVQMMADEHQVRAPATEGIFVHGLYLDGAAFTRQDGQMLCESKPKELFTLLPVIHLSGNLGSLQVKVDRDLYGAHGAYMCPTYKYPTRTDRFFVMLAKIRCTPEKNSVFWGIRGVALLCNTS